MGESEREQYQGATPSRRRFLQGSMIIAGGLLLEIHGNGIAVSSAQAAPVTDSAASQFAPNAWVRITPENQILLVVHKYDSGTGVKNALGLMLAEELDADWAHVKVIQPDDPLAKVYVHPLWGMHATGGSTSVSLEWNTLRQAGATARAMLIAEAAQRWSVDVGECRTSQSKVLHPATGREIAYGALAQDAGRQPLPGTVTLKRPEEFVLIGKERPSYQVADKLTGHAQYAIDVKLPGMLTAIVVHAPVVHAGIKSINIDQVKALPGIHDVFATQIPKQIAHFRPGMPAMPVLNGANQAGVAIVADTFWAAQRARQALVVEWTQSDFAGFNSADALRDMAKRVDEPGQKSNVTGNADNAFKDAAQVVEAVYSMPYKAHAQMEPLSVVVWVKADSVEYWGGIQVPSRCAQAAETITGMSRDQVRIHLTEAGGSFGAREGLHPILEATYIAHRVGKPVKLLYSREDDIRGLYYQTASVHKARLALDAGGQVQGFSLRAVVPSIKEPDDPGFLEKVPVDPSCTEGMRSDFYYDVPALDLAWVRHETGFPTWWWRAVSYVPNIFAIESLVDEAAHAAGQDPLAFRRRLLTRRPELKAVMDRATELAGWKPEARREGEAPGRGLGVAVYEGYKSFIAIVAQVRVHRGAIAVEKITCVVDCGVAVDPSAVRQQLAGGIYWGVSTALYNKVNIENGVVRESNFHDYPVLRMNEAPEVVIELMPPSGRQPGGIGELSNPLVVPAIGNAIFAATGERLRETPFKLV